MHLMHGGECADVVRLFWTRMELDAAFLVLGVCFVVLLCSDGECRYWWILVSLGKDEKGVRWFTWPIICP
jgi:hypothetical protein